MQSPSTTPFLELCKVFQHPFYHLPVVFCCVFWCDYLVGGTSEVGGCIGILTGFRVRPNHLTGQGCTYLFRPPHRVYGSLNAGSGIIQEYPRIFVAFTIHTPLLHLTFHTALHQHRVWCGGVHTALRRHGVWCGGVVHPHYLFLHSPEGG